MRSRRLLPLLLAVFLPLAACQVPAVVEAPPAAPTADLDQRVEAFIEQVMDRFEIPGLSVGIIRDGELAYAGAFGVRSLESGEPLTTQSIFHMASVSKPFVATAIVQLVEQGKIDLEAPVVTYLPYFELADPRSSEITIHQMLTHTAGMPDVMDYEWDKPQLDEGAAERYVRALKSETMIAAPGEIFRYSNRAFDTLGDVIAKVSGKSFEAYMKENILEPLGMHESTFYWPETPEGLRTSGHDWKIQPVSSGVYPYNRRHAPSSTLNSNVVEMARWALANLRRGELDGRRILQPESYDLLWDRHFEIREGRHVGLSWFLQPYRDTPMIAHSGGDRGFSSHFALLPEKGIGIVLASNYSSAPIEPIYSGILDLLLGHEPEAPKPLVGFSVARVYDAQGLEAAKAHYDKLASEAADEYTFDADQLNQLGYFYLGEEQVDAAIEIFTFNTELYPQEANTWDSLGEACMTAGQTEPAIANYRKSLELDPGNDNARSRLSQLGAPADGS